MRPSVIALALVSGRCVQADWQFRSRPDLSPPRLNITIPATKDISPGYLFVTPYPGFGGGELPEQPAGYIFRDNGDLIWSSIGYYAGWVANLQAVTYKGQPVLQAFQGLVDPKRGHGYGSPLLLDQEYRPVAQVQSLTGRLLDVHEFTIVDEETVLVEVYQPTPFNLADYGGKEEQQWIVDGIIQEIDIESGELLFEAHTLDFASPADSVTPLVSGQALTAIDAWDYFHVNSVDKDPEGNYLVSGRHTSALYKISGLDGSLIWQLGGKKSTFSQPKELNFGFQHDARFLNRSDDGSIEVVSFFDNSAARLHTGKIVLHENSRGLIVQLNHTDNSSTILQSYEAPDGLSAESQGNTQVLSNGNVFVNWGQEGAVTEFSSDGTPVFHAYLDTGAAVQAYRGFRYPWTGHSREVPAIVALRDESDETNVYVSWNGDTEVATWRFYGRSNDGIKKLGEVKRTSFETSLRIEAEDAKYLGDAGKIYAEGLSQEGKVLKKSPLVAVSVAIQPAGQQVREGQMLKKNIGDL